MAYMRPIERDDPKYVSYILRKSSMDAPKYRTYCPDNGPYIITYAKNLQYALYNIIVLYRPTTSPVALHNFVALSP